MVVLGHAGDFGLPSGIDGGASHCGVLIFFALSGFLMGDLYLTSSPTPSRIKAYAVARIARIVPIYYLVVCTAFVIHWADPAFVYAITPVQLIRLLTFNGSTSVFWSIGPEVQFYVVFIGLWLLHGRLNNNSVFAAIVLVLIGLAVLTIRFWPGVFVASKFHVFALGMLAALIRRRWVGRLSSTAIAAGHVAAMAILVIFLVPGLGQTLLGATPFDRQADPAFTSFYGSLPRVALAAVLALTLSFESRFASAILANAATTPLGRCSFSIYLLHVAIYDAATRSGFLTALSGFLGTLTVLTATIAASLVTYHVVEAPARRWTRAWLLHEPAVRPNRPVPRRIPV